MLARESSQIAVRVSLTLVGLMCLLPFLQPKHSNPVPSFYSEWLAFILGFAALFPLVLPRFSSPLRVPWIALAPLVLAGVLAVHLTLLKSPYPQQVLLAIGYLVWAACLVVLTFLLKREFGVVPTCHAIAWFVLTGGILNAVAGILQHYDARGFLEPLIATKIAHVSLYGNLGQPNHFANHMATTLASLVFLNATGRVKNAVAIGLCVPLLVVLSLSGSRSSWLYLTAMVLLGLFLYLKDRNTINRRVLVFCALLIPGFGLAHLLTYLPWLAGATETMSTTDRLFALAAGNSQRLQLWREAWLMFVQAPLLGVGWGQFAWHHFLFGGTLPGVDLTGLYNHAHNLVFQLLAETGAIGALPILAGILLWLGGLFRARRGIAVHTWWLLAVIAILGIHSMLEYPLWNAYFLGLVSVILGLGEERAIELRHTGLARLGVAIAVVAGIGTAMSAYSSYQRLEAVLYAQYGQAGQATLQRSHREMVELYAGFLLAPYVELAYARDIALDGGNIEQKLQFTSRVMRFAPTGMVAYRHAALWALKGDSKTALQYLDHAVAAYPGLLRDFETEFAAIQSGDEEGRRIFSEALQTHLREQQVHSRL